MRTTQPTRWYNSNNSIVVKPAKPLYQTVPGAFVINQVKDRGGQKSTSVFFIALCTFYVKDYVGQLLVHVRA